MKAWSLAWNIAELSIPGSSAEVLQIRRTGKGCLSYLIGSGGEAIVVDASVNPAVYLTLAGERGWKIRHVLDTHIHADHLSRGRSLASETGATYGLPAQQRAHFPFRPLQEGDALPLGASSLVALHTPGHTEESTCYLLDGRALITGDTLFLTGVGRPDLEASAEEARGRARALFSSLQRILSLPPDTIILPGHTSAPPPFDGVPLADTLEKVRENVALLQASEEKFLAALLERLPPTPPNHHQIVGLNEAGSLPEIDLTELEAGANRCAVS